MKILIVLANGHLYDSTGNPLPNSDNDGAIHRFKAMTKDLSPTEDVIIIGCGGFTAHSPDQSTPEVRNPLYVQFNERLEKQKSPWWPQMIPGLPVWGTRREIYWSLKLVSLQIQEGAHEVRIGVSNSIFHVMRAWIYGWLFKPKGWKIKIIRSDHEMGKGSNFSEFLKFGDAILTVFTSMIGCKRID